ncbi:hypothetical protein ABFW11_36610, partial [Mycolicibacterium porcinum]|uniref:hypothetical protein n=1 Tax=Mycolicibacterium porcinum TaxID=39693 RepID=UPI0034CF4F6F
IADEHRLHAHFADLLNNAILILKACIQHQRRDNVCAAVALTFGRIRNSRNNFENGNGGT